MIRKGAKAWIGTLLTHLGVWMFFVLLVSLSGSLYDGQVGIRMLAIAFQLPLIAGSAYLLFYRIFPLGGSRGRLVLVILLSVLVYFATVLGNRLLMGIWIYPLLFAEEYTFEFWNWYRIGTSMITILLAHGIFGAFKYYSDWIRSQHLTRELRDQKLKTELAFLRSQLHPHFLFNSLNAVYAELLKDSESAGQMLMDLSGIYRYVLDECQRDLIDLNKEIVLINRYTSLQLKRFGDRLKVDFRVERPPDIRMRIPPLILFSMVENSFKHGIQEQQGKSHIAFSLRLEGSRLHFSTSNPLPRATNGNVPGIGLANTRRQLDLLYGKDFSLDLSDHEGSFVTHLSLPIHAYSSPDPVPAG